MLTHPVQRQHAAADRRTCVHSTAPGRVRLSVRGLYRNPAFARRLQSELRELPGLRLLRVSELTGRLLVCPQPHTDLEALLDEIERRVAVQPVPPRHYFPAPERASTPEPESESSNWHTLPARQVAVTLGTSLRSGLGGEEAQQRLQRHGPNRLPRPPGRSSWAVLRSQYDNLPTALLGGSALISVATGGLADALAIAAVLAVNGWIGFRTEMEAERTISALADDVRHRVKVCRDGVLHELEGEALVAGDLVRIEAGSHIAADLRLLRSSGLRVDESPLTGESKPVRKRAGLVMPAGQPLAERRNMAYMGTTVTGGSGLGVVTATGRATAIGEIDALIGSTRPPQTPLQHQLDQLSRRLALGSTAVCLGIFALGSLRGYGRLAMLKAAVSLGVAAIPEGLGTVATTSLAMGIRDLRGRRVAVRRLDAVETLGALQVLCLDKTGTLTENRMSVVAVQSNGRRSAPRATDRRLLEIGALCNDADLETGDGSSTELALLRAAAEVGIDVADLRARLPRLSTRERGEGRPYMATVHRFEDGRHLLAVKGSPSHVLELCSHWQDGELRHELDADRRRAILKANESMADESLRVLGLASAERPRAHGAVGKLTWLGLVGMTDPTRAGLNQLMARFHGAGVRTIMLTGDQRETAAAIGRELGLGNGESLDILDASQLEHMRPEALKERIGRVHVFARVTPAHKLQIVQALQQAGLVVAMTGDGINDGPALRAADIGIAMGRGGTDVARAVADVVLEDDNLHSMLIAVEQGRTLYDNIRKAIRYLVATNCSEIVVMVGAISLGLGAPLTPMQLLWINLVTDVFPALALTQEPAAPQVLSQPPREARRPVIERSDLAGMGLESGLLAASGLTAYGWGLARYGAGPAASGLGFQALASAQLLHAVSARSERHGLFNPGGRPRNRAMELAIGGSLGLQLLTQLLPPLRRMLGLGRLGLLDVPVVLAGATLPLLLVEARKLRLARLEATAPIRAERTAADGPSDSWPSRPQY